MTTTRTVKPTKKTGKVTRIQARKAVKAAGHTPGPWTVAAPIPLNGVMTKTVQAISAQPSNNSIEAFCPGPNATANARLIAAAPTTAAERDRLAATVKELVEALRNAGIGAMVIADQITAPLDGLSPSTTAWVLTQATAIGDNSRAALARAAQE